MKSIVIAFLLIFHLFNGAESLGATGEVDAKIADVVPTCKLHNITVWALTIIN